MAAGYTENGTIKELCEEGHFPGSRTIICTWHHHKTDYKYLDKLPDEHSRALTRRLRNLERAHSRQVAKKRMEKLEKAVKRLSPAHQELVDPIMKRLKRSGHLQAFCDFGRNKFGRRRKNLSTNMGCESIIRLILMCKVFQGRLDDREVSLGVTS